MRECDEHEITVEKLLKVIHNSTERIKIYVVAGGVTSEDRVRSFYLTEDFAESQEEIDRVLKYYGDVPVWNIHVEWDDKTCYSSKGIVKGRHVVASIVANCHYRDIRGGYLSEKEDIRKAKRRKQRGK